MTFRMPIWGRRVARWSACALIALLTMEGAARLEDYLKEGVALTASHTINTLFQPSVFGRTGKPNARYGRWRMNSLGFRGPEVRSGGHRVVTMGASETFGFYESIEYPRRIEAILDASRPGAYQVINAALPGIRIGNTAYLRDALRRTGADTLVIYPTPAHYIGVATPICGQPVQPVPDPSGWRERLRLAERFDQLAKQVLPARVMDALRQVHIAYATRHQDVMDRIPEASLQAFRADLACAVETARGLGVRVVLITHANYFGSTLDAHELPMMRSWRRFYPELGEAGFMDLEARANEVVRELARQQGVGLVDAAALIPPGAATFVDFVHFSDAGAALMAAHVAAHLLRTAPPGDADTEGDDDAQAAGAAGAARTPTPGPAGRSEVPETTLSYSDPGVV